MPAAKLNAITSTEFRKALKSTTACLVDGQGLKLVIRNGNGFWVWTCRKPKGGYTSRCIGVAGSAEDGGIGLEAARTLRARYEDDRRHKGILPAAKHRHKARTAQSAAVVAADVPFADVVSQWLAVAAAKWVAKTRAAAERALNKLDVAKMPLADIDTDAVLASLMPLPERQRQDVRLWLARALDFAAGRKWVAFGPDGNPAVFEGPRKELWPKFQKSKEHHAAIKWGDLPALYDKLPDSTAGRAARFAILTAARTGEVRDATWSQVVADNGHGMAWEYIIEKGGKPFEQRVPLTASALALIGKRGAPDARLFPDLGVNALLDAVQAENEKATMHGMRATFNEWCDEQTDPEVPVGLIDAALAHYRGDAVRRSYSRGDMFNRRRGLMEKWAAFATAN